MSTKTLKGAMLLTAFAFAPVGTAAAQDTRASEPPQLETVTVVAPRITYDTQTRRRAAGGSALPVEVTEATEIVPIQGLDLNRTADLFVLEERVQEAANRVCSGLERKHPEGEPRTEVCVDRAVEDAMAQVRRMTRAAVARR